MYFFARAVLFDRACRSGFSSCGLSSNVLSHPCYSGTTVYKINFSHLFVCPSGLCFIGWRDFVNQGLSIQQKKSLEVMHILSSVSVQGILGCLRGNSKNRSLRTLRNTNSICLIQNDRESNLFTSSRQENVFGSIHY